MRLASGLGAPERPGLGVDFAGTVEAVGTGVTRFRPGDAVFGGQFGAFAEYLTMDAEGSLVPRPDNLDAEQAAGVPIAALTALQALRDKGHVHPGQKVLINGASGQLRTVIDRHYALDEIAEAIRYSESGRARGKIIIDVAD